MIQSLEACAAPVCGIWTVSWSQRYYLPTLNLCFAQINSDPRHQLVIRTSPATPRLPILVSLLRADLQQLYPYGLRLPNTLQDVAISSFTVNERAQQRRNRT
jgi:hypothetical protein